MPSMALRVQSITGQLARLSATTVRPSACAISSTSTRAARFLTTESSTKPKKYTPPPNRKPLAKVPKKEKPKPPTEYIVPEGHGERIWFHRHILDGMTIFGLKEQFKATKSMRMLPFVGKKLRPSKFRKDYWEPFAMIEFPKGQGLAGLSVHHMLREARYLHNYVWDPETPGLTRSEETGKILSKFERGIQLNAQQFPNTVADMAAVLGGVGKGNKIWTEKPTKTENVETVKKEDGTEESRTVTSTTAGARVPVTVYWSDKEFRNYAAEWSSNVTHATLEDASPRPVAEDETRVELEAEA